MIGLPHLKASHLGEIMCCFKRRCEGCHTYIHILVLPFTKWENMAKSEICKTCLPLLLLWLLKTCIWSSLFINALIIILVSDTVTWTQSPSGGSPSVGLHPFFLGAFTPPNWIPWGLSVVARTGLCWQCCWCYPLGSGHTSTACTHCCPCLHHDVCSYLQSWTGKNYIRGKHVGLKPVKYLGHILGILLCLAVLNGLAAERTVLRWDFFFFGEWLSFVFQVALQFHFSLVFVSLEVGWPYNLFGELDLLESGRGWCK